MILYNHQVRFRLMVVLLLATTFAGCKKFLDTQRQGAYTADNYPYPGGSGPYDQFLFGAYNDLRGYNVHADAFIVTTSIRSDDADKGSTPSDGGASVFEMENFPVTPSNGRANNIWVAYYGLINKCNSALVNVDTLQNITASEEVKLQTKAEARFIRAYGYFMLVRLFGNIPIIDTIYADVTAQPFVPQSQPAQVYAFIEDDLNFAAQHLPDSWSSEFIGRVTRGAANGLLAKVYLTQKKWAQAAAAAGAVMSSGMYDLSVAYNDIFSEQGENSKESVFEVQATASATTPTGNGVQYSSIQGVRGTGIWNNGWGWNTPSDVLEAAYEPGDPRKARTILYSSTATQTNTSMYGEQMPVYPSQVPNPKYNHKVLGNPSMRNSISRGCWWMNVRLLRYADVLLMYAEAQNEAGNSDTARRVVNRVRERARRGASSGVLPDITTTNQSELRAAIRHERRIELAMEHDRFFDLVRWGIAQQAMHAAGKTNFSDNRDVLLPIPQVQRDLSDNRLVQNPGY
ncbi:RagB/SusD family nutrient uptake outer membrane protein [Niabella insulamsoli]|uniref:RagB/SusD family nutrient uptake outer membrane protein n=1 Tax=Niabella insulamsoli TaxID=3144874 RepID=UPI0031FBCBA0